MGAKGKIVKFHSSHSFTVLLHNIIYLWLNGVESCIYDKKRTPLRTRLRRFQISYYVMRVISVTKKKQKQGFVWHVRLYIIYIIYMFMGEWMTRYCCILWAAVLLATTARHRPYNKYYSNIVRTLLVYAVCCLRLYY